MARLFILVSAMITFLVAPAMAQQGPEPVKIGVDVPLTGSAAAIGQYLLWGVEIAFREANASGGALGRPLAAVVLDDETDAEKAVANVRRFLDTENVAAVLGPANSGNALAMIPLMQKAQKPLMILTASATTLTRTYENEPENYIFRATLPDREQISFLVDWATSRYKRIAIACDTTPYGQLSMKDMVDIMAAKGAAPVAVVSFPLGSLDMSEQVRELTATPVDAVAILSLGNEVASFARSADALGFKAKLIGQYPFFLHPVKELPERLSNGLTGVLGSSPDASPKSREIDAEIRKHYLPEGYYPFKFVEAAYEGAMLVIQAVRSAGSTDGPAVRAALERMDSFQGVGRVFKHPFAGKRHELYTSQDLYMGVWENGKVRRLDQ